MFITTELDAEEIEFLQGIAGKRKWGMNWALHQVLHAQAQAAKVAGVEPTELGADL